MRGEPRPYQAEGYAKIREEALKGHHRILGVGPTAMGKTFLACMFIEACLARGNKAMFVVHRREIVEQAYEACRGHGIPCGMIMGNSSLANPDADVQVCSIMTLVARRKCPACKAKEDAVGSCATCNGTGKIRSRELPEAQLIVLDEVHRGLAPSYMELIAAYPKARILGITATPRRLDGKGLGEIFTSLVVIAEMQELIDGGYLLPLKYYAPHKPDLKGVRIKGGEYESGSLSRATRSDAKRIGNIVEHWIQKGEGQTTLFFGVSVEDSKSVADEFNKAGIPAAHVDAQTPEVERAALFDKLRSGEIRVLCNVDIATEGVDIPSLGCVILGRSTKSLTVFLQSVGRAMRLHPGQSYAIILDHAGCVHEHGLPNWPQKWELHEKEKKKTGEAPVITCQECGAIRALGQRSCPNCGEQQSLFSEGVSEVQGELSEYVVPEDAERCECGGFIQTTPLRWTRYQVQKKCRRCRVSRYVASPKTQAATDRDKFAEWKRLEKVRIAKGFRAGWSEQCFENTFGSPPPTSFTRASDETDAAW